MAGRGVRLPLRHPILAKPVSRGEACFCHHFLGEEEIPTCPLFAAPWREWQIGRKQSPGAQSQPARTQRPPQPVALGPAETPEQ